MEQLKHINLCNCVPYKYISNYKDDDKIKVYWKELDTEPDDLPDWYRIEFVYEFEDEDENLYEVRNPFYYHKDCEF